ncbi:hypothetical protein RZN05_05130 [Sphingomonas sp. HF-S4]|uniref:Uncharacterized protein n=1 Tax=Sphingomonas agrestis TaxID=3080540 RepID=A0ABU3Y5L2_9SPHN|nr:hypothetical protein [Sphingomonas sp. HF-S4]MDV3456357.1 hypothetical protein [Sphingomonas sp. HF-S4]
MSGVAASSCMSVEPAVPLERTWSYSPNAPGSQPNPMAIDVPDPLPTGAASSQSGGQRMSKHQVLAERRFETNLDLSQIAAIVIAHLGDRAGSGNASALAALIETSKVPPAASNPSFPSQVVISTRACGRADGPLRQWAETRFCRGVATRYDELRIETFVRWRTMTEVPCSDCVTRYMQRLNAFTIDSFAASLRAAGYDGLGVIEGQRMAGEFRSPLVHSGFSRDEAPLIAVSHRPPTDLAGRPADLTPAIFQLQLYYSANREN